MSLLIKALDKAQEQAQLVKLKQAQNNNALKNSQADSLPVNTQGHIPAKQKPLPVKLANSANLTLEPSAEPKNISGSSVEELHLQTSFMSQLNLPTSQLSTEPSNTEAINKTAAQSAANVFNAKNSQHSSHNITIIVIAATGLLALLAIGVYFYQLKNKQFYTATVRPLPLSINLQAVAPQPLQDETALSEPLATTIEQKVSIEPILALSELSPAKFKAANKAIESLQIAQKKDQLFEKLYKPAPKTVRNDLKTNSSQGLAFEHSEDEILLVNKQAIENSLNADEVLIAVKTIKNSSARPNKQSQKDKDLAFNSQAIASESASMRVTRTQSQNSINPVLTSAFEAYNAGNDAAALKLYKQVLQRDVRNSDALLGLGAIAQRQGRLADANGWYNKVLEVDPKNSVAISFLLENQPQNQNQNENTETQLKNMLVIQPNDANLHALLGNFHAQNNQWPAAQQAYFDAYRLNASAHNALNLAVSLDQMGKPALALPYYQQALAMARDQSQTGVSQIDKTSIEARIKAIS